ncbi:MAG: hypothetical protein H7328_12810 [Bdellovibrio sp.]|nr:hypothetical protein [Bdellovibrio sp.]
MKHKIWLVSVFIILSSCMKVKKKGDEAAPAEVKPVEVVELQQPAIEQQADKPIVKVFSYEYVVQNGRSFQEVQFHFPSHWPNEIILKKTELSENKNSMQTIIRLDDSRTWKESLVGEVKISYQFLNAQKEVLEDVEVLPVLNLQLSEDFNLAQKFKLNAKTKHIYIQSLRMEEKTHLYLEDYSGSVKIENLQSSTGTIQTFPLNQRAGFEQEGRAGGLLQIEIFTASGELNVTMVGENGGHGKAAREPDDTLRGAKGDDGSMPLVVFEVSPNQLFYKNVCAQEGSEGKDGSRGAQGFPGGIGKNGGNSGRATIKLWDANLKVSSPNLAGLKGLGQVGGRGGAGGAAGLGTGGDPCRLMKNGQPGGEGVKGVEGDDGRDGVAQKNSLFLNGQKVDLSEN